MPTKTSQPTLTEALDITDAPAESQTTEQTKAATKRAKAAKKAAAEKKVNDEKAAALTAVVPEVTERVHPDAVTLGRNSRLIPAPNQDQIDKDRAISIALHGQFQPVAGHRDAAGNLVVDDGFTRQRAVKLLRKGFSGIDPTTGRVKEFHDPEALLWVAIDPNVKTDEEAFAKSLRTNHERADTSDLQDALAQAVLRDEYGWNKTRIAREYGYENTNRVSRLEELLELPETVRDLVHAGNLSLSAALDTKPLTDAARTTVLQKATDPKTGKVDGAKVRSLIRDLATNDATLKGATGGEADGGEGDGGNPETGDTTGGPQESAFQGNGGTPPKVKRTASEFKNFAAEVIDESTVCAAEVKTLFNHILEWFDGSRKDKSLWTDIKEITAKIG